MVARVIREAVKKKKNKYCEKSYAVSSSEQL
jgi:hypothetical protein